MKWVEFGKTLAQARLAAGIAHQTDLAVRLGVSQQTVSRWEQGTSRPRFTQISKVASAVGLDAGSLAIAAGYAPKSTPQHAIDLPWPVDALPPNTFERFSAALVMLLHGKDAEVTPYGSQGHAQEGLDIDVTLADGSRTTYQCKRQKAFGPKKIAEAVSAHTAKADRKVILLTSLASPQAREEIKKHPGWQLWDREDITRRARLELSKADQQRLVDIYFPGQRLALLGEVEPSPWRGPDEFFAGLTEANQRFTHAWTLEGHEIELKRLIDFAKNPKTPATLLVGNGGTGKSRLLKELADHLVSRPRGRRVFFLGRDALKSKDLDALGPGPKLLVCDDAHDREDLELLAEYVANPANGAHVLIALRTYGLPHVSRQIRSLGISGIPQIAIEKLTLGESERLAHQALSHFGGDNRHAARLASYTQDCPLATVIAAQILSDGRSLPDFLIDEDAFRDELMSHLVHSTVSGISSGLNENSVRVTLGAIALLQPINDGDTTLVEALGRVASLMPHEVARILKRLRDAGVLFQRGTGSRLVPDLLGDFLIEDECISAVGNSTGFAEKLFDAAPDAYAEHILLNLGRLDWRKSNGGARQSRLLDQLWSRLQWRDGYSQPHLRAVAAVAYYQPRQALEFVRRMLREGRQDELLARIVGNVAYDFEYLAEACQLLWEIGRDDARPLNQQPSHGVRLLAELASPHPGKPPQYMDRVVDFALSLIPLEESWKSQHSPLEILVGALVTEGHTTSSTHRAITMKPFLVSQSAVAAVRKKVIAALIDLLTNPDASRATAAAGALHEGLRFPHGLFGTKVDKSLVRKWETEFVDTLKAIDLELNEHPIAPLVLTRLGASVSWHANSGEGERKNLAEHILARLDRDLRTRTIRMLVDGWGHLTRDKGHGRWEDQQNELKRFSADLISEFGSPQKLYVYMEDCLKEVTARSRSNVSPHILVNQLIRGSTDYARVLLHSSINHRKSESACFAGTALAQLLEADPTNAHAVVDNIVEKGDGELLPIVAEAYGQYRPKDSYTESDVRALKQITTSSQVWVQRCAASALREVALVNRDLAVDLGLGANLEVSEEATHDYLMWFCDRDTIPFEALTDGQVQAILKKLLPMQAIDDHWVREFIKKAVQHHPGLAVEFFKSRVGVAMERDNWSYRPVPWASGHEAGFGLEKRPDAGRWFRELFEWALSQERLGESVLRWFGDLIKVLCAPFDKSLVGFIEKWVAAGARIHLEISLSVLREAPQDFVFAQQEFVLGLLRSARSYGAEALRKSITALYVSADSGMRSGTPGKPYPQDIARRNQSRLVLEKLGRFEPAYELYDELFKSAELDVARQKEEGRLLNEADE